MWCSVAFFMALQQKQPRQCLKTHMGSSVLDARHLATSLGLSIKQADGTAQGKACSWGSEKQQNTSIIVKQNKTHAHSTPGKFWTRTGKIRSQEVTAPWILFFLEILWGVNCLYIRECEISPEGFWLVLCWFFFFLVGKLFHGYPRKVL